MPYRRSNAAAALGEAARSWRRRSVLLTHLEAEQHHLLSWIQIRPDRRAPIPYEQIDTTVPQPPGLRVLLAGDPEPWFVRWPLVGVCWLSREPQEQQLSRINPVELLWADEPNERHALCGRAACLRAAATGDVACLANLLEHLGWQAAAAMVQRYSDDDGIYECGAGRAPQALPSPSRVLRTAFAESGNSLDQIWLEELCAGGEDWDSGDQALLVPRG